MAIVIGHLAAIDCEPRQVRKEAAAAVNSSAELWLMMSPPNLKNLSKIMSYQVLALKWRPRSFQEVVGQPHVVQALINALNQNRLHHAYLFTGTRGVGKTSMARILAKCLNCTTGPTATPCDTCDNCLSIHTGQCIDLIEVDAASRTKVEDTRELLNNAQYGPNNGRYKIYLIDEVHMLSGHSFNALLKTLEEPPLHVKFLLATTDLQKLPATILSRCLQFHLKHMPSQDIAKHLGEILSKEGIPYEQAALHTLANAADGSMRDALSLLDQAIAYGNQNVKSQEVMALLGNTPNHYLIDIIYQLKQYNPEQLLAIIATLHEQSIDFTRALEGLLSLLHQIAIIHILPNAKVDECWQDPESIRQLANRLSAEEIQLYYQIGLIGRRDLPLASNPKNGFEMVLLRMLAFKPLDTYTISTTATKTSSLPDNHHPAKNDGPTLPNVKSKKIEQTPAPRVEHKPNAESTHTNPSGTENQCALDASLLSNAQISNWPSLLSQLNLTGMTQMLAMHCSLEKMHEDTFFFTLAPKHAPLLTPTQQARLTKAISDYLNKTIYIEIIVVENTQITPAQLIEQAIDKEKIATQQTLKMDNALQSLIDHFDATLIPESVERRHLS